MVVRMSVGFPGRVETAVLMTMMLVVNMGMRVRRQIVNVSVLMTFGEMQPDTEAHEPSRGQHPNGDRLSKRDDRGRRAEKRRCRKICARPRRTEMTQRINKQHEAHAISKEADDPADCDSRCWRERTARQESEREVDGTCDESLDLYDLQRV